MGLKDSRQQHIRPSMKRVVALNFWDNQSNCHQGDGLQKGARSQRRWQLEADCPERTAFPGWSRSLQRKKLLLIVHQLRAGTLFAWPRLSYLKTHLRGNCSHPHFTDGSERFVSCSVIASHCWAGIQMQETPIRLSMLLSITAPFWSPGPLTHSTTVETETQWSTHTQASQQQSWGKDSASWFLSLSSFWAASLILPFPIWHLLLPFSSPHSAFLFLHNTVACCVLYCCLSVSALTWVSWGFELFPFTAICTPKWRSRLEFIYNWLHAHPHRNQNN